MKNVWGRSLALAMSAAFLCLAGCFGGTQNPSYFPYLLPTGDIIQTHAKPIGPGYYANFDPKAVRLEVEPKETVSQVGSQVVLLATVYDDEKKPRRNRRVEWMVDGVGSLVEVDESGVQPGRGYKTSNKHGVSYTNWGEHRLTRGNKNERDDLMLRPGQTWAALTSPVEGDTHVTVLAPGIYDWQQRTQHRVIRWVDVTWEFPPPATQKFGSEHVLTTRVLRFTDRKPLKGYAVRYRIIDGPPARFLPSNTQQIDTFSDLAGEAKATLVQATPASGANRIAIEIIRPPDPTTPAGAGTTIATGETSVEWLAPNIVLTHQAPAPTPINQEMLFTTTMQNTGRIESGPMRVTCPIPDGLEYVRANPPALREGESLTWTFGALGVGQQHQIQTIYRGRRAGPVRSIATVVTEEGQRDSKEATTEVTTPGLKVSLQGPEFGSVGTPATFQITMLNTGSGPLDKGQLIAEFEPGLEHERKSQKLTLDFDALAAGQSRNEILVLTPKAPGRFAVQAKATASGVTDSAVKTITVQEPKLSLKILAAPQKRIIPNPAEFRIGVENQGDTPLTGVTVRARLPQETEFAGASGGGAPQGGEVVWNVGTIQPRGAVSLDVSGKCVRAAQAAVFSVMAAADGGLTRNEQATFVIEGVPALDVNITDEGFDPAPLGKSVVYRIKVANRGSAPNNNVVVMAKIPPEMKYVKSQGPGPAAANPQLQGDVLVFPKVDNLQPGGELLYLIEVETLRAGDVRLDVQVTSAATPQPVRVQEPTRIVAPQPIPNGPPGGPGGGVPNVIPVPPGTTTRLPKAGSAGTTVSTPSGTLPSGNGGPAAGAPAGINMVPMNAPPVDPLTGGQPLPMTPLPPASIPSVRVPAAPGLTPPPLPY